MIDIKVDIDSYKAQSMLEQADIIKGTKIGLKASATHLISKLRVYPPAKSDSKYKRTNDLKRFWAFKSASGGLKVEIGNKISYMPYVQGDKQAKYFKTNWSKHSVEYIAKKYKAEVTSIIQNEIKRRLK